MRIDGRSGFDTFLATSQVSSAGETNKTEEWEKLAEELERLRKLKRASEALETSEMSQGGAPAAQAPGQEESKQNTNVSSPDEDKKREVSDPVKLAAYSIGASDFLEAMKVLVPTLIE
jgi:hypothetical protein